MNIKTFCRCSVFLPGRAKDLSAPLYNKQCAVMDKVSGNLEDPLKGATLTNSRRHSSLLDQFVLKTPATTDIH
jgi:hypothetical protein